MGKSCYMSYLYSRSLSFFLINHSRRLLSSSFLHICTYISIPRRLYTAIKFSISFALYLKNLSYSSSYSFFPFSACTYYYCVHNKKWRKICIYTLGDERKKFFWVHWKKERNGKLKKTFSVFIFTPPQWLWDSSSYTHTHSFSVTWQISTWEIFQMFWRLKNSAREKCTRVWRGDSRTSEREFI